MTVLLVDGRNALFRHQHAGKGLSTAAGMPTGAVYGMLLALCARRAEQRAHTVEVCWEGAGEHWRHQIFPSYKRRRPDHSRSQLVDAVRRQEPWAQEMLTLCGVRQWRPEDGTGEGDDALAARARYWRGMHDVVIESGDADLCQLVSASGLPPTRGFWGAVSLWKDGHLWGPAEVESRLGIEPARVPDLKALLGDPSDCYPGCPGIGPAKACGLLTPGQHLDPDHRLRVWELLDRAADGGVPGKTGRLLVEHRELVLTCYRLAQLDAKVPLIETPPEVDLRSLETLLRGLECYSLAAPHRLEALGRLGGG